MANEWRRRLKLPPSERWARASSRMRPPRQMPDKSYAAITTPPPQRPGFLSLYLPSNGSLLAAIAHLAAALHAGHPMPDGWHMTAEDLTLVTEPGRRAVT